MAWPWIFFGDLHSNAHILLRTTGRIQIDSTTFFGLFTREYIVGIIRAHRLVHWAILDVQWVLCGSCSCRHFRWRLCFVTYLRSMQRLPTTKRRLNAFTAHSSATPKLFMSMGTVVLWPFFMFHWLVLKLLGEMNRVISVPLHWFYLMNILFFASVCVSNCPFMKGRKKFCQASHSIVTIWHTHTLWQNSIS